MDRGELYRLLGAVGLGQFASLLVTFTGLTSSVLTRQGIDAPTSQSFCNYLLLALFYGCTFLRSKKRTQVPWYYYLILAFVDVEGNYLVVKAYQYTSLTSVMLLDCWTIPCVILLTWFVMKTKYKIGQLIGAFICILGLALVLLSDVHASDRSGGSNAILGDTLVIIGSTFYAVSNVSEELIISKVDFIELMAFLGFFGAIISACQVFILEWQELESINWTQGAVLPFIGFAVSLFLFYTVVPLILKLSGSALLNLSLLTSDMWAVVIRVFAYHQEVDWLFFIAFATVAVGLSIYTASEKIGNFHISKMDAVPEEVAYEQVVTAVEDDRESQEAEDLLPSTSSKDANENSSAL